MSGGFLGMPGTQWVTNQTNIAIGASGKPIRVYDAVVVSGGTASTVKLYNGTSATGSQYLQLDGIISKSSSIPLSSEQGVRFENGCFAAVDSNTVNLMVSFVQEF